MAAQTGSRPGDGRPRRRCCHAACLHEASATYTYDYDDATVALGPLSPVSERHGYDLCALHAGRLRPPVGWRLVRYLVPEEPAVGQPGIGQPGVGHPPSATGRRPGDGPGVAEDARMPGGGGSRSAGAPTRGDGLRQ